MTDLEAKAMLKGVTAEAIFADWFHKNYPGHNTIITRPDWHAPKIFRAVLYALRQDEAAARDLVPALIAQVEQVTRERDALAGELGHQSELLRTASAKFEAIDFRKAQDEVGMQVKVSLANQNAQRQATEAKDAREEWRKMSVDLTAAKHRATANQQRAEAAETALAAANADAGAPSALNTSDGDAMRAFWAGHRAGVVGEDAEMAWLTQPDAGAQREAVAPWRMALENAAWMAEQGVLSMDGGLAASEIRSLAPKDAPQSDPVREAARVRVKALEWRDLDTGNHRHETTSLGLKFEIEANGGFWWVSECLDEEWEGPFLSLEAAKAAAQADYEARILAALEDGQ